MNKNLIARPAPMKSLDVKNFGSKLTIFHQHTKRLESDPEYRERYLAAKEEFDVLQAIKHAEEATKNHESDI